MTIHGVISAQEEVGRRVAWDIRRKRSPSRRNLAQATYMVRIMNSKSGKMAQWLGAHDDLAEDPGLFPGTHMVAHKDQVPGHPMSTSVSPPHIVLIFPQAHTHTHKNKP